MNKVAYLSATIGSIFTLYLMSAPAQKELSSGPVMIRTFILPSSPTMSIETLQQDQKPIISKIESATLMT
jgi:hypothetical protein